MEIETLSPEPIAPDLSRYSMKLLLPRQFFKN
jgi:hypothetical protein